MGAWRYAYMRHRTGETAFVDCRDAPRDDLCKR
jgi:hypothetical protein